MGDEMFEPITFTHHRRTDPDGRVILKPVLSEEMRARLIAGLPDLDPDDDDAASAPSDTISVKKAVGYIPVGHDYLCDFTDHECTPDCPPPFVPEPVPLLRRAWWRIRNASRWVTGLRVAHKDRIDNDEQW